MLQQGDPVPHFEVKTVSGELLRYSTLWQRRTLVLFAIPPSEPRFLGSHIEQLVARNAEFLARGAECVITRDPVPGIPSPGVVVADKWGEIAHIAAASRVDDLTSPHDLLEWVDYLNRKCPECEGEAR